MKIAISSHPHAGGSGIVASELAQALALRGHEVHLVACTRPLRLRSLPNLTFHPFEVNDYPLFRFPPHDLCLINKLSEIVRDNKVDIIHAHYAIPHSIAAHLAREVAGCSTCRVVTTLHGTDVTLVGSHPDFFDLTRFAMEQSDGLTAVSSWLREKTNEFFNLRHPIEVVPNFVDTNCFNPAERAAYPENGRFEILHISNFRPVKRVTDIIRAFELIRRDVPAHLTLIGDGPERGNACELAGQLKLTGDVTTINVTRDLAPFYRKSHLFLLLSDYESFGVSALEALACGTPVIASNAGGLPEVIASGEMGFLCEVGNFRQAAEKAKTVLGSRPLWEQMSKKAADESIRRFHVDRIVPHYEAFYRRMLDRYKN